MLFALSFLQFALLLHSATLPGKKKRLVEEFVPPSKPDYSALEKVPASKIASYPEFVEACKAMSGYYQDSSRNPKLKNTIFISGINYSYKDFYHNFKCYTDRLGIKFLPISLDENIYAYLKNNKVKSITFLLPFHQFIQIASDCSNIFNA